MVAEFMELKALFSSFARSDQSWLRRDTPKTNLNLISKYWTRRKTVYAEIDVGSSRRCIERTRTTKTMNSVGQLGEEDDEKADSFKIETTMVRRITNLSHHGSRFSQV
ncbi:hypothetical protein F2Q68_00031959 [Brassica cretica]|uniref:Uncharacterized protein n=1 Tax=Brassica cretica TaxID=69181 RepID=A0A8S9GA29_BRACR|nr:hypothetical protein F2Q68_00031959 [Brassica cretica]